MRGCGETRDAVAGLYPTAEEARITCAIVDAAARVRDLNFKYLAEGKGATVTATRARVLAIPSKAAGQFVGLETINEAHKRLKAVIYSTLKELGKTLTCVAIQRMTAATVPYHIPHCANNVGDGNIPNKS